MKHIEYWLSEDSKKFDNEFECVEYEFNKKWENNLPFTYKGNYDCIDTLYDNVDEIKITNAIKMKEFINESYCLYGVFNNFPIELVVNDDILYYDENVSKTYPYYWKIK